MTIRAEDWTPEEQALAQQLLDERVREASREEYRRMVADRDPRLNQGPVRVPRAVVERLRQEVAGEVVARRASSRQERESPRRRWPWQRG